MWFCGKDFNEFDKQEEFGFHYPHIGYGSKDDGASTNIDLCCDCFDKMMKEYVEKQIKPTAIPLALDGG